jgi:hypothetical protein
VIARELKAVQHSRELLRRSVEEQQARAEAAEGVLAAQQPRVIALERELQAYQSLPTIRLRDRMLRVPFVGGAVRRAARALAAPRD